MRFPIGYTYTDAISREELEEYDTLKRQGSAYAARDAGESGRAGDRRH